MKHENLLLIALGVIAFFVVGIILQEFRALLRPFAVAVLFSILFYPMVSFLQQKKVPIAVALLAVLGLVGVTMVVLGNLLYASAIPLIQGLPEYQAKLDRVVNDVAILVGDVVERLGLEAESIDTRTLLDATTVTAGALSRRLDVHYTTPSKYLKERAGGKILEVSIVGKYHLYTNGPLLKMLKS